MRVGRWKELKGNYFTPGGTPVYVCAKCGGSEHLHGVEYPRRRVYCNHCGTANVYPWEKVYDMETPAPLHPGKGLLIEGTPDDINTVLQTLDPNHPRQHFENAGKEFCYVIGGVNVMLHVRSENRDEN